jgi:hypothetical protein
MADELKTLRAYIYAVANYWWAIITGLALTILDGVERIFGTWYQPPLWKKVTTAVAGLAVAQYLAYRDLARSFPDTNAEFKERLRHVLRNAEVEWEALDGQGTMVTPQMICKQVDEFRAAVVILYSQCPPAIDSQPLHDAIEKLDTTKAYRMGNFFGSQQEAEQICKQMDGALADVRAMLRL